MYQKCQSLPKTGKINQLEQKICNVTAVDTTKNEHFFSNKLRKKYF